MYIYVSYCDYLDGTPTINKPLFINPELTLQLIDDHDWYLIGGMKTIMINYYQKN